MINNISLLLLSWNNGIMEQWNNVPYANESTQYLALLLF